MNAIIDQLKNREQKELVMTRLTVDTVQVTNTFVAQSSELDTIFYEALTKRNAETIELLAHLNLGSYIDHYYPMISNVKNADKNEATEQVMLKICRTLAKHGYRKDGNKLGIIEAIVKKLPQLVRFFVLEEPKVKYSDLTKDRQDYIESVIFKKYGTDKIVIAKAPVEVFDVDKYLDELSETINKIMSDLTVSDYPFVLDARVADNVCKDYVTCLKRTENIQVHVSDNGRNVRIERT